MNISHPYESKKNRAQTMVEFALVIPTLLLLIYGLLETGRLLFIYGSTITAARQAARYGSATGELEDGTAYYNDCTGIRAAAQKVGFINRFEDADIAISYDRGLNSMGNSVPLNPNPACGTFTTVINGDRIIVEVKEQWVPIVPLVPLKPFTITSISERTIFKSIAIDTNGNPGDWVPPGLSLSIAASSATYSALNEMITYTYTLQNTGTVNITSPYTFANSVGSVTMNCSSATSPLVVGASTTCTGTYYITQADITAGIATNNATATANSKASNQATATITLAAAPQLSLLTVTPLTTAVSAVGSTVTYTYALKNTGNVSLTSPTVTNSSSLINDGASFVFSGCLVATLAPNDTTNCTGTYTVTAAGISAGQVVNTATAHAMYGAAVVNSLTSIAATIYTKPLAINVVALPTSASAVNQVITYTYTILNNSGASLTLTGVTDINGKATINSSCNSGTIANGSSKTCTGTYTVTTADYTLGASIVSAVYASATTGAQTLTSSTVSISVPLTQIKTLSIALVSATPSQPAGSMIAGVTTVTFIYSVTNTGNMTLTAPSFSVNGGAPIACGAAIPSIPPGVSINCTNTQVITVTQSDIDAGSITKTAIASGTFGGATVASPSISTTVITFSGPRFNVSITQNKTEVTPADPTITYTYTLTNTGNTTLSKPYMITSSLKNTLLIVNTLTTTPFNPDCTAALNSITPGQSTSCTYTYSHPSATGSATLVNSTTLVSIGGTSATAGLPSTLTATVYNCTSSNFTVAVINATNFVWQITNSVGKPLPITSIIINWANAGAAGGNNFQLNTVTAVGLSGFTLGTLPNISGSYTISGGTLTGSSLAAGVTTLTFTFSKNNPSITAKSISVASPYGSCSK